MADSVKLMGGVQIPLPISIMPSWRAWALSVLIFLVSPWWGEDSLTLPILPLWLHPAPSSRRRRVPCSCAAFGVYYLESLLVFAWGSRFAILDELWCAPHPMHHATRFPMEHWRRIRTNNAIKRLNREIKKNLCGRTFPDSKSALMLVTARLKYVADSKWGSRRCLDVSLTKWVIMPKL